MNKRIVLKIYGLVQGVFYRQSAQEKALELGLSGFVRNEKDGTVKIVAEGKENDLKKFIDWCWEGSPYAKVENIEIKWENSKDEFTHFEIKY
jgi:acylphosphatase